MLIPEALLRGTDVLPVARHFPTTAQQPQGRRATGLVAGAGPWLGSSRSRTGVGGVGFVDLRFKVSVKDAGLQM